MAKPATFEGLEAALAKRSELIKRFMNATGGLTYERRLAIVFSWMPIERIEECVELQEKHG